MLLLSDAVVRDIYEPALARETVRLAAREYSAGRADVPPRTQMHLAAERSELLVMPGALDDVDVLGVKTVGEYPHNLAAGLPTAPATVLLLDSTTGAPAAFVNATSLTRIRTAAMSVVAAEHLAIAEPQTLGVVGAGGQALAHIQAFAERYPLTRIRLASRTIARAHDTARAAAELGIAVGVVETPEEAVSDAHLVVAATTSRQPVVPDHALAPGTCVIGVGAHRPQDAEIDTATVARAAQVAVDTRRGSIDGAGDIARAIDAGALGRDDVAELGGLVDGRMSGRTGDDDITVFKSIGFAALDLVACHEILDRARRRGLGVDVVL